MQSIDTKKIQIEDNKQKLFLKILTHAKTYIYGKLYDTTQYDTTQYCILFSSDLDEFSINVLEQSIFSFQSVIHNFEPFHGQT